MLVLIPNIFSKSNILKLLRDTFAPKFKDDKHIDDLSYTKREGGIYVIGQFANTATEKEQYPVHIYHLTRSPNGDTRQEKAYTVKLLTELSDIPSLPIKPDFLFKLNYHPDTNYFWRQQIWNKARRKLEFETTPVQQVLARWLLPPVKPTKLAYPNLHKRLDGTWQGWKNTPNIDYEHNRYSAWEKNDVIEDEAFEIYKELVKPLEIMPKVFNDILTREIKKPA